MLLKVIIPNGKFDTLTKNTQDSMTNSLTKFMETLSTRLDNLTKTTQDTLNHQQQTVQTSLKSIQESNEKKLEEMRVIGLFQQIQDEYKVTITGPTSLGAFLNSLQRGFRTLAIQKETSKVWDLLGSVKTEFGKFGDVLAATKKKLDAASTEIGKAEVRSRAIEKKLKNVDALPTLDT